MIKSRTIPFSVPGMKGKMAQKLGYNLTSQGSIFMAKWIFNFSLAKLLPPAIFGVFTLIQALGNFFMNLFSFGAVAHLIHSISESKKQAFNQLYNSIRLSAKIIALCSIVWVLLILIGADIPHIEMLFWPIIIGGLLSINAQLYAFFKGLSDFKKEAQAAVKMLILSILIVSTFWLIGITENIHVLLGLFSALQLAILFSGIKSISDWKKSNSLTDDNALKLSFKERIPFGLHEVQGAIYIHVILLILGFMVPEEDLAMYRSIQLFITPVSLLPGVVSQVTLNKLSSQKSTPLSQIATFRKFLKLISLTGVFFFLMYALVGEQIISHIYDYRYDRDTVRFLIWSFSGAFMLRFISSNYGVFITSAGKQSIRVLMTFLSILVSVVLTYVLTKSLGVKGAALAGVASFGIITLGYGFYCEAILFKKLRKNASNDIRS